MELSENLAVTFVRVGPGVSADATFCPPMPIDGRSAVASTTIPMPPSQCVNERQKSTDFACDSISVIIVAPVVEKPEHSSKNASKGFGIAPVKTIGTAPMMELTIQIKLTIKKPSLCLSLRSLGLKNFIKISPTMPHAAIVAPKQSPSKYSP